MLFGEALTQILGASKGGSKIFFFSFILSLEDIANEEELNNPEVAEMHVLRMVVSKN